MTRRSQVIDRCAPASRRGANWLIVLALATSVSAVDAQKRHAAGRKPTSAPPAPAAAAPGDDADSAPDPAPSAAQPESTGPSAKPEPAPAAATPVAEAAAPPPDTAQPDAEVASLQQELAQVMDDLVQARARVALLGKSLFKTRVRVRLDNRAAETQTAVRVALFLDGAPIWSGDGAAVRDPEQNLFDGVAAPGPHVLGLEIEQRSRGDDAYRYTLRDNYHFNVLRERRTDLTLILDDDSDIAEDFKDDDEGEYDVHTKLEVRAAALNEE
jgi:hypothetical protein